MANSDVPYLFLQIALSKTLAGNSNSQAYYDTALFYMQKYNSPPAYFATYYQEKAVDLTRLGLLDSSFFYVRKCRQMIDSFNLPVSTVVGQLTPDYYEAEVAIRIKNYALAIDLLQRQLTILDNLNLWPNTIQALLLLSKAYFLSGKTNEAYLYMQQAFTLKENLLKEEKEARTLSFETERKMQENDAAIAMLNAKNESNRKTKYYLVGIISLLSLLAIVLTLFYINKRKNSKDLSAKNGRLSHTLEQLKSTQRQLIQSEKMASLGELTAGIAHEIKNPLNFVNNFSEVSKELIEEVKSERSKEKSERDEGLEEELLNDILQNLEKITHHGKRADAIVKGMLQHSRSSSGQKESTNINALCDEYLRLAYHGLKAKDASFSATFHFEPDELLPKVNVVPQDIGRVLLNLINNAFQAVSEKQRIASPDYAPEVKVSTKLVSRQAGFPSEEKRRDEVRRWAEIVIKDNGPGISDSIFDKIFQPFFTTKPTGQGTGLGLSLSYDIIKAHGGDLIAINNGTDGASFIITLPLNLT
jgi:signal transduction histidine kinase